MERKKWLETFIKLADTGAAAIDYRKKLRLKVNVLGTHIKSLPAYRKELSDILQTEVLENEKRREQESRDTTRQRELESRLREHQGREDVYGQSSSGSNAELESEDGESEDEGAEADVNPREASREQESDSEDL